MPLKRGSSKNTVSSNIAEIMHGYTKSRSIGSSKPKSVKVAQKQAVAIAMSVAKKPKQKSVNVKLRIKALK